MAEIENLQIVGGAIYTVGNQDIIADDWEAGKAYIKDRSYAIKEHKLYQCAVSHTSVEPFDPTKWTEKTVAEALGTAGSANMIECTLAEYTAWKAGGQLINETVYVITDAPNLNATAQDISYDGGADTVWDKVESKADKAWTYIDKINLNGTCSVSGYSEVLIILYVNNNRNRESYVYPVSELSEDTEMHSIIVNSSANVTNYANATVKVTSNTLSYTGRSLVGWNGLYLKIYAR